jgi:quinolinate synthase
MSGSLRRTSGACARATQAFTVLAHPDCPPEVIAERDFTGIDRGDGERARAIAASS